MERFHLDRLLELLSGIGLALACLWIGLAAISMALLVFMHTRWGQAHPLRKCLILSLFAHALLGTYATTVQITFSPPTIHRGSTVEVALVDVGSDVEQKRPMEGLREETEPKPWETFSEDAATATERVELPRVKAAEKTEIARHSGAESTALAPLEPVDHLALSEAARPQPENPPDGPAEARPTVGKRPETIEAPAAENRRAPKSELSAQPTIERPSQGDIAPELPKRTTQPGIPSALLETPLSTARLDDPSPPTEPEGAFNTRDDRPMQPAHGALAATSEPGPTANQGWAAATPYPALGSDAGAGHLQPPSLAGGGAADPVQSVMSGQLPPRLASRPPSHRQTGVPEIYRLRVAPDRSQQIERRGATGDTEQAVQSALKWLADHQASSGDWIASDHGAGLERMVNGRDRQGAGAGADTGMSGLALLAFLAAGNTHQQGTYQATVGRGINYLLAVQGADGNLAGVATEFAAMYCHAMGTLALSEAYGMTRDTRLREPVQRAVAYTVSMQNPATGGWRYRRGDDGDTSQLGWQLMALKSAELAGISVPPSTWHGAARFLRSVSSGTHGGLGSYRPGERVSFAMTAEALVCRQFLGLHPTSPTANEAGDYLLRELPGESNPPNEYYWYYGTLAMYQLQGPHWDKWNEALRRTLLASQRRDGTMAGSWDTDTMWGGYGGRVYTTAIAALSLEVYYRYLPLYENAQAKQ